MSIRTQNRLFFGINFYWNGIAWVINSGVSSDMFAKCLSFPANRILSVMLGSRLFQSLRFRGQVQGEEINLIGI